jgi:hypothetical protein
MGYPFEALAAFKMHDSFFWSRGCSNSFIGTEGKGISVAMESDSSCGDCIFVYDYCRLPCHRGPSAKSIQSSRLEFLLMQFTTYS